MKLHYGDLTDSTCLVKLISQIQPDEIYNLGAMSHVKVGTPPPPSTQYSKLAYSISGLYHLYHM